MPLAASLIAGLGVGASAADSAAAIESREEDAPEDAAGANAADGSARRAPAAPGRAPPVGLAVALVPPWSFAELGSVWPKEALLFSLATHLVLLCHAAIWGGKAFFARPFKNFAAERPALGWTRL